MFSLTPSPTVHQKVNQEIQSPDVTWNLTLYHGRVGRLSHDDIFTKPKRDKSDADGLQRSPTSPQRHLSHKDSKTHLICDRSRPCLCAMPAEDSWFRGRREEAWDQ